MYIKNLHQHDYVTMRTVTVLECANASGSFQLSQVVIEKSTKHRALKNYNFRSSLVVYNNQKNALMDVQLFQDCSFF